MREPTGDEVLILADYFKADYNHFISNERLATFERTEELFRMHGSDFVKGDRWAIQEFLFLCECEDFLLREAHEASDANFSFVKRGRYVKLQAAEAAAALRKHLGLTSSQASPNIYRDLRRIGIHVFRRKLSNSKISGIMIRHPSAGNCVLVNYEEDIYRQRFTAAHECGHTILDTNSNVSVSYTGVNDLSEVGANVFASNFLIPADFLARIPAGDDLSADQLVEYSKRLMVNPIVLLLAIKQAGRASEEAYNRLKAVKINASDKQEPEIPSSLALNSRARRIELLERGLSTDYVNLCFSSYERGIISRGRLAEVLLTNETELAELAILFGIGLKYGD